MILKENILTYYDDSEKKTVIEYGSTKYEIEDYSRSYYEDIKSSENIDANSELGKFLLQKNLIENSIPPKSYSETDERTISYIKDRLYSRYVNIQEIVDNVFTQNIVVIGCGGIGTIIVENLVRSGFSNFTLVDGDYVEMNNLNRQLFYTLEDIKKPKVEILQDKIKQIRPYSQINSYQTFINSTEQLINLVQDDSIFLINCADTPKHIESIVASAAKEKTIPMTSAYVGLLTGTWGPIYDKNSVYDVKQHDYSKTSTLTASISMTNMIVGTLSSQLIFDYLLHEYMPSDYSFFKEYIIDFNKMVISHG